MNKKIEKIISFIKKPYNVYKKIDKYSDIEEIINTVYNRSFNYLINIKIVFLYGFIFSNINKSKFNKIYNKKIKIELNNDEIEKKLEEQIKLLSTYDIKSIKFLIKNYNKNYDINKFENTFGSIKEIKDNFDLILDNTYIIEKLYRGLSSKERVKMQKILEKKKINNINNLIRFTSNSIEQKILNFLRKYPLNNTKKGFILSLLYLIIFGLITGILFMLLIFLLAFIIFIIGFILKITILLLIYINNFINAIF